MSTAKRQNIALQINLKSSFTIPHAISPMAWPKVDRSNRAVFRVSWQARLWPLGGNHRHIWTMPA